MPALLSIKQSSKKYKYLLIIVLAILLFGVYLAVWQTFKITQIEVQYVEKPDSSLTIRGLSSLYDEQLYLVNQRTVSKLLSTQNPYIRDVQITKQYPSTLLLTISLFKPIALLEVAHGYFLLSGTGRILQKTQIVSQSLPLIHFYQKLQYDAYQAGDNLDFKDITSSLEIAQKVTNFGIVIDSIDIDGFSMIALNTTNSKIIFTNEKDKSSQLYSLEKVIQQFKVEGKTYKTIDLRFDKVVVDGLR